MTENTDYFSISKKRKIKILSEQFIYAKLLFIYSALYTLAFVLGTLLFHALEVQNSAVINSRITAYFNVDFLKCENIFDKANLLLDISSSDISHLLIIFIAGFTMLVSVVISILLIFKGFSLGFLISYFAFAVQNSVLELKNPALSIIVFSIVSAITAAIMIHIGVKTTCFSDDFKALGGIPRKIIKSKALYSQLFRFLIAFGAVLILNLFRCVL